MGGGVTILIEVYINKEFPNKLPIVFAHPNSSAIRMAYLTDTTGQVNLEVLGFVNLPKEKPLVLLMQALIAEFSRGTQRDKYALLYEELCCEVRLLYVGFSPSRREHKH